MPESPRSVANFTPIAIVGRACLLPGASSPAELAELVFARREAITAVGRDRWGMARERVMTSPSQPAADRAWSDRGGYVTESVESPADLGVSKAELDRLDPLVRWLCVVGQRALREAPPPLRAPFKTSPDGHRTAPLSRGPGSVPPPPLAPVLVVMSGPQVGERIRVSSDFGALRDAEKSYGNVHSPEHLNTEAPTVDCGRVADRGGIERGADLALRTREVGASTISPRAPRVPSPRDVIKKPVARRESRHARAATITA